MTETTKYTPGPWHSELGEVHEVRDSQGGRICILTQLRGRHGLGGRRDVHESPANARLISAAPEMAEALLHARYRNHDYSEGCDGCLAATAALQKAGLL